MRQPANSKKIQELKEYHSVLKDQFRRGELEGKISKLLILRSIQLGITMRTYYRKIKCHSNVTNLSVK